MSTQYEVYLLDAYNGDTLAMLDHFDYLHYVKRVNDMGVFKVGLAPEYFDINLAHVDARVVIWRRPDYTTRYLEFAGFLRLMSREYKGEKHRYVLEGPCYNDILNRRVVAYPPESSQAFKADQADDMMKAIVKENLGSSATAGRNITAYDFTIQRETSQGTIVRGDFAYGNVLDVLKEIAAASRVSPSYRTYFGIVPLENGWPMEFRTNVLQWGQDHATGGVHGPVIFALERANIAEPKLTTDRMEEVNTIYAGGQGEGPERPVIEVQDINRRHESPFNRREAFYDESQAATVNELIATATSKLDEGNVKNTYDFNVVEVPSTIYGLHWNLGDVVVGAYGDARYVLHVISVEVRIENGKEKVSPRFETISADAPDLL